MAAVNRFKWTNQMYEDLLNALKSYKTTMEYNNLDFNADNTKQYEAVHGGRFGTIHKDKERPFGPDNCV